MTNPPEHNPRGRRSFTLTEPPKHTWSPPLVYVGEPSLYQAAIFGKHHAHGAFSAFLFKDCNSSTSTVHVCRSAAPSQQHGAFLLAVLGVVEVTPFDSILTLITHNKTVAQTFQEWVWEWEAAGWKKANGKAPDCEDILRRYVEIVRERDIEVDVKLVAANDWKYGAYFKQLSGRIDRYIERAYPDRL